MALGTEALHGRHAVAKWSAQVTHGTPVTAATAMGIVPFRMTSDADMRRVLSIGSAPPIALKPGIMTVPFSLPISPVQEGTLLKQVARVSGTLPELTLLFAYVDDAATAFGYQVQDCKIATAEIELTAGGMLNATLSGHGFGIVEVAVAAVANLSDTTFMSYEGVFLKAAGSYPIESFRFTVDNNIRIVTVIPGAAPATFKRQPSYQVEGNLFITGSVRRFVKSSVNLQADTIAAFALDLTCTDIAGGGGANSIQFAFTGAKFGSEEFQGAVDDLLMFETPFEATGLTITVV